VCGIAASTSNAADCNDRKQKQFESLYREYAHAVRDKNSEKYLAFFADDFSMRSPDGKVHNKAEMTRYQKVNAETTRKVNTYTVEVECVRALSPSETAVVVLQKYDRDQAPLEQPDKPHNIRTSVVQRETWRKTPDGWKIALTGFAVIWIVALLDQPGRRQNPAAAGPPPEFIGAGIAMFPGAPLVLITNLPNIVNGMMLPLLLPLLILLANDKRIMGRYANSPLFNLFSGLVMMFLTAVTLAFLASIFFPGLFGGH